MLLNVSLLSDRRLVNNILNLEMLDSGKMRLNLELCDINIMVEKSNGNSATNSATEEHGNFLQHT